MVQVWHAMRIQKLMAWEEFEKLWTDGDLPLRLAVIFINNYFTSLLQYHDIVFEFALIIVSRKKN